MGKFSGVLLCSDFDGTLAYKKIVPPSAIEAIRYFQDHGGTFTLATGRYPSIVPEAVGIAELCNAPMITLNGTLVYDQPKQRIVYESFLPQSCAQALLTLAREMRGLREFMFFPRDRWKQITLNIDDEEAIREVICQPLYKAVVHVDDDVSDAVTERLRILLGEKFSVCRSWINGIEFHSAESDKGKTARRVANMIGADRLIGIGDYENDISLLREADVGCAMGNAIDSLKQIADFVTDSVDNDGFANMIYRL